MHEYGKYYLLISERMFYIMRYKGGERELEKVIFHIDVNSAFLSWEAVYRLHHLDGKAI